MVTLILTEDELKTIIDWGRGTAETYPDDWTELDESALQKCETASSASEGGLGDGETPDAGGSEVEDERQMEFPFIGGSDD